VANYFIPSLETFAGHHTGEWSALSALLTSQLLVSWRYKEPSSQSFTRENNSSNI